MQKSPPKRSFPSLRKYALRLVAGFCAVALLYGLFGFFVLPRIVKSQTEKLIAEKLHRPAAIGTVDINPFALTVALRDVKLREAQGDAVFAAFDALFVNLSTESVLRLAPVIQEIRLTKPSVRLVREDANRYNIDDIIALLAAQPPSPEPARFSINNIQVENGRIEFDDKPAGKTQTITELALGVPFISSLPSQVQIFVEPLLSAKVNGTPLLLKGKARPFAEPKDAMVELNLEDLDLTRYLAYLPFKPRVKVPGARLAAHLTANFKQPKDGTPALTFTGDIALKSLQIDDLNGKSVLKLPQLTVSLRDTAVFGNRVEVARVALNGLEADVSRNGDGELNLARLLPPAAPAPSAAPKSAAQSSSPAPIFALVELQIRDAALRYADDNPGRPMRAGAEKLDLTVRDMKVDTNRRKVSIGEVVSERAGLLLRQNKPASQAARPAAASDAPAAGATPADAGYAVDVGRIDIGNWTARVEDRSQAEPTVTSVEPLSISVQGLSTAGASPGRIDVHATVNNTGRLAASGSLGIAPLRTDLAIDIKNMDVLPLQPYIADKINLRLTRANLSASGKLQLDSGKNGMQGGFKGDVMLGDLATVDKISGGSFLRWKTLAFNGMDMRLQPFALSVNNVVLNDFFARIIIDSGGRINLQNIVRSHPDDRKSVTDDTARPRPASAPAGAAPSASAPLPPIRIGKLSLQGGRVRFTDNFIKPNYSANLSDFGGVVTDLSSDPSTNAKVNLRGSVNSAPLTVSGRVNPLKGDLFLDLKASVRGMELAPLSAYSGRYIGYGIEKGKLSFDVSYRVENRTLTAENRLVLEQLTIGDKVDSPTATSLPVRFAVALLSDRNGVIDLNLPIGGSLDDPQFSIGSVIFKAIGNLLAKAVTQPFALLGSLFGGHGEELSSLEFDPGRSAIPASGEAKLRSLADALAARPALKLEITGRADPDVDRAGLQRAAVERKVRMLKYRDLSGANGASVTPAAVTVNADEYPDLLKRAYRDEKFPKPRNALGLPKNLSVEEMEKLMIANTTVDEDDLIALANQRAQAAKDWLLKNGHVPADRIFLLAAKLGNQDPQGNGGGKHPNRVDFSLR